MKKIMTTLVIIVFGGTGMLDSTLVEAAKDDKNRTTVRRAPDRPRVSTPNSSRRHRGPVVRHPRRHTPPPAPRHQPRRYPQHHHPAPHRPPLQSSLHYLASDLVVLSDSLYAMARAETNSHYVTSYQRDAVNRIYELTIRSRDFKYELDRYSGSTYYTQRDLGHLLYAHDLVQRAVHYAGFSYYLNNKLYEIDQVVARIRSCY